MLDRIGNVLKHILTMEERGADRGTGDSEGAALHKEDVDGELLKAFMTTDASAPDVPIVDTSPGFQVRVWHSLKVLNDCPPDTCAHSLAVLSDLQAGNQLRLMVALT